MARQPIAHPTYHNFSIEEFDQLKPLTALNMYNSIIEQNNAAVQMLRNGQYNDASIALRMALMHLQVSFRSSMREESKERKLHQDCRMDETTNFVAPKESYFGPHCSANISPLEGTRIKVEGNREVHDSDAYLALYDRAFSIPFDETRERAISSVILYNCALASHISGVLHGNSGNLLNALNLYKYSFRILQELATEAESVQLLYLALYNNLGHASFQLFHLDEAEFYVKCLREEMGMPEDDGVYNNDEVLGADLSTIEDEDYDFFCFNVAIRVELLGAPAA